MPPIHSPQPSCPSHERFFMRALLLLIAAVLPPAFAARAFAGDPSLTPNPEKWRPVVYRDLQIPGPTDRPFTELWADLIAQNNRRYAAVGDRRYAVGNAPVREAHFVVRAGDKVALLSVLDTATGCKTIAADAASNIAVKMCPMRLAFWRSGQGTIRQAQGCYLETGAPPANFSPDPKFAVSYASYDAATKSIKLGVILAHRAIEKCSQIVPLYPK